MAFSGNIMPVFGVRSNMLTTSKSAASSNEEEDGDIIYVGENRISAQPKSTIGNKYRRALKSGPESESDSETEVKPRAAPTLQKFSRTHVQRFLEDPAANLSKLEAASTSKEKQSDSKVTLKKAITIDLRDCENAPQLCSPTASTPMHMKAIKNLSKQKDGGTKDFSTTGSTANRAPARLTLAQGQAMNPTRDQSTRDNYIRRDVRNLEEQYADDSLNGELDSNDSIHASPSSRLMPATNNLSDAQYHDMFEEIPDDNQMKVDSKVYLPQSKPSVQAILTNKLNMSAGKVPKATAEEPEHPSSATKQKLPKRDKMKRCKRARTESDSDSSQPDLKKRKVDGHSKKAIDLELHHEQTLNDTQLNSRLFGKDYMKERKEVRKLLPDALFEDYKTWGLTGVAIKHIDALRGTNTTLPTGKALKLTCMRELVKIVESNTSWKIQPDPAKGILLPYLHHLINRTGRAHSVKENHRAALANFFNQNEIAGAINGMSSAVQKITDSLREGRPIANGSLSESSAAGEPDHSHDHISESESESESETILADDGTQIKREGSYVRANIITQSWTSEGEKYFEAKKAFRKFIERFQRTNINWHDNVELLHNLRMWKHEFDGDLDDMEKKLAFWEKRKANDRERQT